MKTQALIFTIQEITAWLNLPLDNWTLLPLMVFGVIAMCFAGRGIEVKPFDWSCVTKELDPAVGRVKYIFKFIRKKRKGPPLIEVGWVTDPLQVKIIQAYCDRFGPDLPTKGRFFQHLKANGYPRASNGQMGYHHLDKAGPAIAMAIGKSEAEAARHTSHAFKRSIITTGSNNGMNETELMLLTNHASASSLRVYIAQSEVTLNRNANILPTAMARAAGGATAPSPAPAGAVASAPSSPVRKKARGHSDRSPSFFDTTGTVSHHVGGNSYHFTNCFAGMDAEAVLSSLFQVGSSSSSSSSSSSGGLDEGK